ncbi:phage protein Gp13 family protein [Rhodopseudomonas palustris]|uniref:phage protein Gp13 family protein n=1 Tax=Rhodopseudomonas palustris TaxID=1076 RepID=UPI0021F2E31F|nr:phage protein Gp13 family protein [Rhodopseudomonas palustris]UYO52498.1 DUF2833 domain-containing protein [Rhodopseudomonas palustris]
MRGYVQRATVEDVTYIANHLRQADRDECDAMTGAPPELILPQSVGAGRDVWTFHRGDGLPAGVFGVDPTPLPEVGIVWMVSTDEITNHKFEFLTRCRPYVEALNDRYPIITNMVDARNTLHHRWLKWLGFSFLRRIEQWGARSVPFYEFARMKQTCA